MATYGGSTRMNGGLTARKIPADMAPLSWRLRNKSRPGFLFGAAANAMAKAFSKVTGIPTMTAVLRARVIKADGTVVDYGVLGRRVVTDVFVNFMVDQMVAETTEWGDFKFHDSGEDNTAESAANTDMGLTDGEARATGSQGEGASANIYQTVGTISYTTIKSIVEHGVFSQITGGTLLDRTVFTSIGVDNGDSIQFTYELTVNSGG